MSDDTAPQFVDLQVHTTASDGALPPTAVIEAAKVAGLYALAVTDHDTVDGVDEAILAGARLGVRIVVGVELSAWFEGEELHLLGLHLAKPEEMRTALAELRDARVTRAQRIVNTLNGLGVAVTMDAVLAQAGKGAVGRPHIARALVAGGWVKEFRDAFDVYLGFGRPAYAPKDRFEVADAIALVHRAGGIAVWAHPGEMATASRLGRLKTIGLDGVEVLHPSHPPYLVERLIGHAETLGLLPSGGSDWHGNTDGHRRLGGMLVPKAWLDRQDAHLAAASAAASLGTIA